MEIVVSEPGVANMVVNQLTRFLTKMLYNKKYNIDNKSLNQLYTTIFGFSIYFLYVKNNINYTVNSNISGSKYYQNAIENCKKYGTMLVVRSILTNNLTVDTIKHKIIPTLIGYIIFNVIIEKYLDDFKVPVIVKKILIAVVDTLVVELIENQDFNLYYGDLLGRFLYEYKVKEFLIFK